MSPVAGKSFRKIRARPISVMTPFSVPGREVLHGVGADVGVKFPFFAVNFAVVCPCPFGEEEKSEEKRRKAKKSEEKRRKAKKTKKCVKKRKMRKKRGKSLRPHLHQPH